MKIAPILCTALLAVTSLQFLHTPGWPAAAMFILSVALFGLVTWLDNRKTDELEGLKKQMMQIENKLNGLSIAKGFGR